jgi:hypothetical protein
MEDTAYKAKIEQGAEAVKGFEDLYGFGKEGTRENPAKHATAPTMADVAALHDKLMGDQEGDCYHEAQGRKFITERKYTRTRRGMVKTSYLHIYVINSKGNFEKGYCTAHYRQDKDGNYKAI